MARRQTPSGATKLPLLKGIFEFVLTAKSALAGEQEEQKRDTLQDLLEKHKSHSIEEDEQERPSSGIGTAPPLSFEPIPIQEIISLLQSNTGILTVEIDQSNPMFLFSYQKAAGGAVSLGVAPWLNNLLPREAGAPVEPRLAAEALFNTGPGFRCISISVSDEEAAQDTKTQEAIRRATGLVWHQYMLRAFDRAVSTKAVLLYARVQKTTAPLEAIPVDVWPLLEVVDWEKGIAVAPEGTKYWSIQAEQNPERSAIPMKVSESATITALSRVLHERGDNLKREEAYEWLKANGFSGLSERRFRTPIQQ